MAASFYNSLCDTKKTVAISAGTNPSDQVHPVVLEAMKHR